MICLRSPKWLLAKPRYKHCWATLKGLPHPLCNTASHVFFYKNLSLRFVTYWYAHRYTEQDLVQYLSKVIHINILKRVHSLGPAILLSDISTKKIMKKFRFRYKIIIRLFITF